MEGIKAVSDDTKALKSATAETQKSLPDEWNFYARAQQCEKSNPHQADRNYREGLTHYPKSRVLNGAYALFLMDVSKDADAADRHFKLAIEADQNDPDNLGNYATFLRKSRKDAEGAEEYYKRAIMVDPNHANNLGNYASFLADVRKDMGAAENYYKLALEVDPNHANNIGNYANFLGDVRKDLSSAEAYYKRAVEVDQNNKTNLSNYAQFLLGCGRHDEGIVLLDRALANFSNLPPHLRVGLLICRFAHDIRRRHEALSMLKDLLMQGERALEWTFDVTLDRAARDQHPEMKLLTELVWVVNGKGDLAELDKFPSWRNA